MSAVWWARILLVKTHFITRFKTHFKIINNFYMQHLDKSVTRLTSCDNQVCRLYKCPCVHSTTHIYIDRQCPYLFCLQQMSTQIEDNHL